MTSENDKKISALTVKLSDSKSLITIGTGVIYTHKNLRDCIYIITASHCLFSDGDSFQNLLSEINIDLYDVKSNSYKTFTCQVQEKLLFKDKDKDLAILCIEKQQIEELLVTPPSISIIQERHNFHNFVVKGFPNATKGKELAVINPIWKQNMTEVNKFQLQLTDDYTEWNTKGFSGSGIFLEANGKIYLYGIFTRFRPEDKGRVIYCQFIESLNKLLESNYLPQITFSFLGDYGLTEDYFQKHIEISIENLRDRYDKNLNFKLPIAQRFSDIAKDKNLKEKLQKIVDNWLIDRSWRQLKDNREIGATEMQFSDLQDRVKNWIRNLDFSPNNKIELNWIIEEIDTITTNIDKLINSLYDQRAKEQPKNKNVQKEYSYNAPYENEIERLREINSNNYRFIDSLSSNINIQLVNNPLMIIQGEAGSGKSHLLGDIAKNRIEKNTPTILLLGQLFQNTYTIEKNILTLLDLNCSFENFLIACNDIGKQIDSRLLILIDAINESTGAYDLWTNQLAGFISQVEKYSFIGLVITIRDTYYDDIIPSSIKKNEKITFLSHEGFSGNEYEALQLFCNHYQLEQPKFPILAPEFSKPLFLKLVCEAISKSENKVFPNGFQGINRIFDLYIESLNDVFLRKPEYKLRRQLVREVIQKFSIFCFQNNKRQLLIEESVTFFDDNYVRFRTLLSDLIQEGVLTKNLKKSYGSDKKEEIIYFTYEKLGDYHVATELLNKYSTNEEILMACQKDNDLGILLKNYVNNGIIEALTVLLPENHQLEIFEVFEWLFTEEQNYLYSNSSFYSDPQLLNHYLLESFKWRTPQSIDTEKISNWLGSDSFQVDYDNYLLTLLELTTVENHPFNSDRLFQILIYYSMPERDSFWQEHIKTFSGYGDDNQAFPIRRLIEWAWLPNISSQTSFESARLAGQSLAWVLSSTHNVLRDEITKALVNLLEQQPDALISILDKFKTIDDLYILERLYAVAYGCTLRTEKNDSIQKIAQFTYDTIFKSGTTPAHILLRDYARNIIEYAIYKKLDIAGLNEKLIRPPYKSTFPLLPSEQDIQKYNLDYKSENFKKTQYGRLYNYVYFSVMTWDFGRKIIEPKIEYFSPYNFKFEGIYKEWLKKFTRKQKETIKNFILSNESKERLMDCKGLFIRMRNEQRFNIFLKGSDDMILHYDNLVESQFNEIDKQFIRNEVISHFIFKIKLENDKENKLNSEPIKRWIVQRVFDLGYDVEIHGRYDSNYTKFSNISYNYNTERISKKYQWIAYYEILAFLTDQHKVRAFWGSRDKYDYYKGTWQMFLRDIDPIMTTKNVINKDDSEEDTILSSFAELPWWSEHVYNYWYDSKSKYEWVNNIDDLPKPKDFILKYDENGNEWVSLEHFFAWKQPKPLGHSNYSFDFKKIDYSLNSYIINKKDKAKIIDFLQNKNLWTLHLPKNQQNSSGMMNREKFWSPAYFDQEKEPSWEKIPSTRYKVIVSTTNGKGLIEEDKSGTNTRYNIPCKTLFEALCLKYAPTDGDFKDESGQIIVKAINPEGVIIRKDELFEYLDANDLDIIWTISGEKIAREEGYRGSREYYHIGQPCGVFYFNGNSFSGHFKMHKRL